MANEGAERKLTPEQYENGWLLKVGDVVIHRDFEIVRRLPDGNVLVREPSIEAEILPDGSVR